MAPSIAVALGLLILAQSPPAPGAQAPPVAAETAAPLPPEIPDQTRVDVAPKGAALAVALAPTPPSTAAPTPAPTPASNIPAAPSPQTPAAAVKSPPMADTAPPPAPVPVQVPITLHVAPTVSVQPTAAPAAAAPSSVTVSGPIVYPGLIRRCVGHLGERLATVGQPHVLLPRQVAPTTANLVYQPPAAVVAPSPQSQYQPVLAAPRKGLLGRIW